MPLKIKPIAKRTANRRVITVNLGDGADFKESEGSKYSSDAPPDNHFDYKGSGDEGEDDGGDNGSHDIEDKVEHPVLALPPSQPDSKNP